MKFSVATNWQKDLIPRIKRDCVIELYGKLTADFVGGGRSSVSIPYVSKRQAAARISEIHKNGFKFNYLLYAICLDNLEWTISGQRRLRRLIDWLMDIGVDSVTVSIPYLLALLKKKYPQLEVYISTFAGISTVRKAKYWEDLGADRITLAATEVNRDFGLLREIRKNVRCKLQLTGNLHCLYNCPFGLYHSALTSHSSQSTHPTRGFVIDYCYLSCSYMRMKDPINFIRASWIRPEDVHHYEDLGINRIKLVDRGMTTEALSLVVNAYANGRYDGNLLDLLSTPTKNIMYQRLNLLHKLRYFFRPFSVNIFKLYKGKKLFFDREVYVDNQALDGFLEYFLKEDCRLQSCQECGYCEKIAKQVVKINPSYRRKILVNYRKYLDDLISGKMFKYL